MDGAGTIGNVEDDGTGEVEDPELDGDGTRGKVEDPEKLDIKLVKEDVNSNDDNSDDNENADESDDDDDDDDDDYDSEDSEEYLAGLEPTAPIKNNLEHLIKWVNVENGVHGYIRKDLYDARILTEIKAHPEWVKESVTVEWLDYGDYENSEGLPLHLALEQGLSETVILALLKEYPDAAHKKIRFGNDDILPIELPFKLRESSLRFIETRPLAMKELFQAYPEALTSEYCPLISMIKDPFIGPDIIMEMIEACPDIAQVAGKADKDGLLPLHHAIRKDPMAYAILGDYKPLVLKLLKAYPKATEQKVDGMTTLDLAFEHIKNDTVIMAILKAYPDATKAMTKTNCFRLLIMLHRTVPQMMISEEHNGAKIKPKELTEIFNDTNSPLCEALTLAKMGVDLPLETILSGDSDRLVKEAMVLEHIKAHPEALTKTATFKWNKRGRWYQGEKEYKGFLLHFVLCEEFSEVLFLVMLKKNPEAAKKGILMGRYQLFPLTIALEKQTTIASKYEKQKEKNINELVIELLKIYPDAAKEMRRMSGYSSSPELQSFPYNKGALPLHLAIESKASVSVVEALINANSDALRQPDHFGRTPLDVLYDNYTDADSLKPNGEKKYVEEVMLVLLCADMPISIGDDASIFVENLGKLKLHRRGYTWSRRPLHHAVKFGLSLKFVQKLLKLHNGLARAIDFENKLPIDILLQKYIENIDKGKDMNLREKKDHEKILLEIVEADMPITADGEEIPEHGGTWTTCVASTSDIAADVVRKILDPLDKGGRGFFIYIHQLSKVRDKEGRTALELSASRPKEAIYTHLLFCGRYELSMNAPEHVSATSVLLRATDCRVTTNYGDIFDEADADNNGALDGQELETLVSRIGLRKETFLKGTQTISRPDFISECNRLLGDGSREVVVKLMDSQENWKRETSAREQIMDPKFVIQLQRSIPPDDKIEKAITSQSGGLGELVKKYSLNEPGRYAVIMEAADRNLHQIAYQERPKTGTKKDLLKQLFEAVAHLHEHDLMHGDIKMLNVVRLKSDNRLRLIDFDAAVEIIPIGGAGESFAGAKFSSATLPPEMFFEITTEEECQKLDAYWERNNVDKETLQKVKAKVYEKNNTKKWFAVKSYCMKDGIPIKDNLPYDLQEASEKIDVWALGALSFALLSGESLIPSNRDDDCATGKAMEVLYNWGHDDKILKERLGRISTRSASDFVAKMLRRKPEDRPTVAEMLQDPFFQENHNGNEQILKGLEKIHKNTTEICVTQARHGELLLDNKRELENTREVLLKGIFEATEVTMPTVFIVLPDKLPSPATKKEKDKLVFQAETNGFKLSTDLISVSFGEDGPKIDPEGNLKKWNEMDQLFQRYWDQPFIRCQDRECL